MHRSSVIATVVAAFFAVAAPGVSLAAAGDATEFGGLTAADPSEAPNPIGIAAGPDGNLWFAEEADAIGRITTSGTVTEFPTPTTSSAPHYITKGPDGNMWFTEHDANKIGRITPAGTIAEYSIPTADSGPNGIVAGPNGNLWFVETDANQIGEVTTDGQTFREFPIPTDLSSPWGIAAGADGNLWFTEEDSDQIGKITTSGTFTEFALPADPDCLSKVPEDITAGPDGAMWFSEKACDQIGRIPTTATTTSPQITEYLTPTNGEMGRPSGPKGIVSGPDGDLWFVEETAGQIGRITPSGTITEFGTIAPASLPADIAVGADNNLWATEQFSEGHIARVLSGVGTNPSPPSCETTGTCPPPSCQTTNTCLPGATKLTLTGVPAHLSTIHTKTSTTLSYTLSSAAGSVKITFTRLVPGRKRGSKCVAITRRNRHKPACTRSIVAATVSGPTAAGPDSVTISAHEGGHTLAPGVYRVTVQATDSSANAIGPATTRLKIVK